MNSAFANFGLSAYPMNPSSPSGMGSQLGTPLYENFAAASSVGGTGLDSRSMNAMGPNLMAAAAEFQNLSRLRNQTAGSDLQVPLMDPLYLQYLRSNE